MFVIYLLFSYGLQDNKILLKVVITILSRVETLGVLGNNTSISNTNL